MTDVFKLAASRSPRAIVTVTRGLVERGVRIVPVEDLASFLLGWLELCELTPLPELPPSEAPPEGGWAARLEGLDLADEEGPEDRPRLSEYAIGLIHPAKDRPNPCGAEALFSLGYTDVFKQLLVYVANYHDEVSRGERLDDDYRLKGLLEGFAGLLSQVGHARDLFELADWISERKFPRELQFRDRFDRPDGSYHDYIRKFSILDCIGENLERIRRKGEDEEFRDEVDRAIVSPHPANRAIAVSGLPDPAEVGIEKIRAMLMDPSRQVRLRVLELLLSPDWSDMADAALDVVTDPIPEVRKRAARILERHRRPHMLRTILENLDFQVRQAHRSPGHDRLYKGAIRCTLSEDEQALRAMVAAAMRVIESLDDRPSFEAVLAWLRSARPRPIAYPESVQFFFLGDDQLRVERFFDPTEEVLRRLRHRLEEVDPDHPRPAPREDRLDWALRVSSLLPTSAEAAPADEATAGDDASAPRPS